MAATLFLSVKFCSLPSMGLHSSFALPTQAPRAQLTVKPPLLVNGLKALISFQVFSRMGVGTERVAVGEEGMSPFWREAGVPSLLPHPPTLVSETVLLPSSSL